MPVFDQYNDICQKSNQAAEHAVFFITQLLLSVGSTYSHQHSYLAFVVYNDTPSFSSTQVKSS
jgi:hypothetical protein